MTNPKIGGGSVVDRFAQMNRSFNQRSKSQESAASSSPWSPRQSRQKPASHLSHAPCPAWDGWPEEHVWQKFRPFVA